VTSSDRLVAIHAFLGRADRAPQRPPGPSLVRVAVTLLSHFSIARNIMSMVHLRLGG